MTKPVIVVPYDPAWFEDFAAERVRLAEALGPAGRAIHHVGSTSVPGLAAKPVIDVLVEAESLAAIDGATPELEARGYEARGEYGIPGRRYFVGRTERGLRLHVHVHAHGHPRIAGYLSFRDYLRSHPAEADAYGALKLELAARFPDDRDAYQDGKAAHVEGLLARAAAWGRAGS